MGISSAGIAGIGRCSEKAQGEETSFASPAVCVARGADGVRTSGREQVDASDNKPRTARHPLDILRAGIDGEVIVPQDADYDIHRKVWNADFDRRPAVIVRAFSESDVSMALVHARTQGLEVVVRSGGHSFSGLSVADGALMINLRRMNRVTVNPETRRATVQAGCVWGEVDHETQRHGLVVTGGQVSHTGVAGLTLGGGMGYTMRAHGLTIDNLVSVRVVTADGRIVRASEDEHPDLFFGLRGGGGNFGIATEFEFRLHPLGPTVLGGQIGWSREQGPQFLRRYAEFLRSCPDELMTTLIYLPLPPLGFVPPGLRGAPGWMLSICGTDIAKAEQALADLRRCGPPAFDVIQPMPYLAVQGFLNEIEPFGTRLYGKSHLFDEITEELLLTLHEQFADLPTPHTKMFGLQMGGAIRRVPDVDTAFTGRRAAMAVMFEGEWKQQAQREQCVEWVRRVWSATLPFANGVYQNFASHFDDNALRAMYGDAKYDRLRELKARYDPDNVFHHNHNIKPLPAPGEAARPESTAAMRLSRFVVGAFDTEESAAFYRDVLGFTDLGLSAHTPGARALRFDGDDGIALELDIIATIEYWRLPNPYHIALETDSQTFENLHSRLKSRGGKVFSDPPPMIDNGQFGNLEVRTVQYRRYFFADPTHVYIEMLDRLTSDGEGGATKSGRKLRLNHLIVGARDVVESVAFYCGLFGFKDLGGNPHDERARTLVFRGADGSERLELILCPFEEYLAPNPVHCVLEVDGVTYDAVRTAAVAQGLLAPGSADDSVHERKDGPGDASIAPDHFFLVDPSGMKVEVLKQAP